jgi:hypothetical protein
MWNLHGGFWVTNQSDFQTTWLSRTQEIPTQLWNACFPAPLEGQFFYSALEECGIEEQFTFSFGIIHKDGEPIGIIPTFLMDMPLALFGPEALVRFVEKVPAFGKLFPFLVTQRTIFIGSPCTDQGTVGLLPGVALSDVAGHICDELAKRAEKSKAVFLVWKDFIEKDRIQIEQTLIRRGMFRCLSYPGTDLVLEGEDLESYYSNLKSSRRHNLKKKIRRSKERAQLDVEVIQYPEQALLDEIFALFWQTYQRGKTKFEELNPKFFQLLSEDNRTWFVLLRSHETNRIVAFMLCFKIGDCVINKFIGLDYSVSEHLHLYMRLFEAGVEWAYSVRAKYFQSGQTGYRAKLDLGHQLVKLTNYCQHRNPFVNWIYSRVAKDVSWQNLDSDLAVYLKAHPEAEVISAIPHKSNSLSPVAID